MIKDAMVGAAHGRAMMADKLTGKLLAQGAEASKKTSAVGQLAKAAIAEAKAEGAELPSNIQGKVASAIARGIDPASVFAALVEPMAPEVEEVVEEAAAEEVAVTEETGEGDGSEAMDAAPMSDPAALTVQTDAEAALAILLENNDETSA